MRILAIILLFCSFGYAQCYFVPCSPNLVTASTQAKQVINDEFKSFMTALDRLKEAYDEYNKALNEQNELLAKIEKLKANSALLQKEILFLMKQNNAILSVEIDSQKSKK